MVLITRPGYPHMGHLPLEQARAVAWYLQTNEMSDLRPTSLTSEGNAWIHYKRSLNLTLCGIKAVARDFNSADGISNLPDHFCPNCAKLLRRAIIVGVKLGRIEITKRGIHHVD